MSFVGNDRTAAWANIEDVMLYVGSNRAPSIQDWTEHCDFVLEVSRKTKLKSVLVVDQSSGPNAKQRGQLAQITKGLGMRVAVLSPSVIVRGAATAISWLNGTQLKAFAPGSLKPAFQFLGLSGQVAARLEAVYGELERALREPAAGSTSTG